MRTEQSKPTEKTTGLGEKTDVVAKFKTAEKPDATHIGRIFWVRRAEVISTQEVGCYVCVGFDSPAYVAAGNEYTLWTPGKPWHTTKYYRRATDEEAAANPPKGGK